ncbi:hypothetical protein RIF29_13703 [Crotalaria pallida]|uniref:SHSP domain-containing protein n=1 Tax=Crotalaria pallida TaxID=3830 RepID=A0AAN9P2C0_CROPI
MAMRPRTPTFRAQPSVRRVYETLQPKSEMKQSPEAYLLHVYLPGYTKERIKIYVSSSSGKGSVRISGERPVQGNRWSKFDQTYPLPENCEAEKLVGKFEFGTLILTVPKKKNNTISQASPKQEVKTTQEKDQPGSSNKPVPEKAQETVPPQYTTTPKVEEPLGDKINASLPRPSEKLEAEAKPEEAKENIPFPPQYTAPRKVEESLGDKKNDSLPSHVKGSDDLKQKAQKGTREDTSPKRSIEKGLGGLIAQKGQQEETVRSPIVTGKPEKGEEGFEPKPRVTVATKTLTDEKPKKGSQEEVDPKPTLTTVTRDPAEEKGQEEIRLKTELATIKKHLEEKTLAEDAEKERVSKKEAKEDGKPYNMEKAETTIKGKDTRTSEVSPKELAEPSGTKVPEKSKEDMINSVGSNGITELVATASQVVARIAEGKLNEEEKHLAVNMGAAVLVIAALGAYVSYRFASSG